MVVWSLVLCKLSEVRIDMTSGIFKFDRDDRLVNTKFPLIRTAKVLARVIDFDEQLHHYILTVFDKDSREASVRYMDVGSVESLWRKE